jgi:hypothetical protein
VDIPPDICIKSTIRPGSVYYFVEESFSSPEPHYFIVINRNPVSDNIVLLVCSSSQIEKVKRRRKLLPPETLVEIKESRYINFTTDSIIDCNNILQKTKEQLIQKLEQNELKLKMEMDIHLVEQLRQAVKKSPLVEEEIKKFL